jgi:hypothetical protein
MRLGSGPQKREAIFKLNSIACAQGAGQKPIGAVAASMLTAAYHMIATGTFYQDPGADHFERGQSPARSSASSPSYKTLAMKPESNRWTHDSWPVPF